MAKIGLETRVAYHSAMAKAARKKRDASTEQAAYKKSLKLLTKDIESAIKIAGSAPELGIAVSRACTRFVIEAISDPGQDQGRALFLKQCDTLEHYLALVKDSDKYLATMQNQFGPNLNARDYAQSDPFNTIIKSQKQRIYTEGQGFNTQEEKNFCRKRSELLAALEKTYNHHRTLALGLTPPDQEKTRGR
jgi:hypothetical protein